MVQPFAQLRPKTVFFFKKAQVGFSILERALSRILKQDRKSKFRHVWTLENLVILVFLQKFQFNFAPPSLNLGSSFEKCTIFIYYFVHVPYFSVTILIVRAGQLFLWKNADCEKIVQKLFFTRQWHRLLSHVIVYHENITFIFFLSKMQIFVHHIFRLKK